MPPQSSAAGMVETQKKVGGQQTLVAAILARSCTYVLTAALWEGEHSCFQKEEKEPQEDSAAAQGHATSKQQSWTEGFEPEFLWPHMFSHCPQIKMRQVVW